MCLLFVPVPQPKRAAECCRTDIVCTLTVNTEHFVLTHSRHTLKSTFLRRYSIAFYILKKLFAEIVCLFHHITMIKDP